MSTPTRHKGDILRSTSRVSHALPSFMLAIALVFSSAAQASDAPMQTAIDHCAAFATEDFSAVAEAPSHLKSTSWAGATSSRIAHCQIDGYIASNVGIRMVMPSQDEWNGKFMMYGCGGFCGVAWIERCESYLNRGYACIASDMGHQSTLIDGKWAYNNRPGEIDFGFRSTHLTAVAGKAITERFYDKAHDRSYYFGCSTGGRQGVISAQAFPFDFDGIIAGAPVINETHAALRLLWTVTANYDEDGRAILSPDKLPALHAAVLSKCDANDGLRDGLISEPLACQFDPDELRCGKTRGEICLNNDELDVVRKIYQGPVDAAGNALNVGGVMPGSELNWTEYLGSRDNPSLYGKFMNDYFRFAAWDYDPGSSWTDEGHEYSRDVDEYGVMERIYNASNPDLRRFHSRGGKLLMFHGWRDQSIIPTTSIDFHLMATRAMGGRDVVDNFYRLFLIPGMNHCRGGPGPHQVDYLTALENWVEQDKAPDELLGQSMVDGEVAYTRPIYPYPIKTLFNGQGDGTRAENFSPSDPATER